MGLGASGASGEKAARARERLEARLRKLQARLGAIESDLRQPENRDSEERALEAENDQVLEELDRAERDEVARIRAALDRIDAGTFGVCERCGGPIAEKRLEAIPEARYCVRCAD
jgi:RNA polymerase-binding transcription factor DksA